MTAYERRMLVFEWILGTELVLIFLLGLFGKELIGAEALNRFQGAALPLIVVAVCGMMLARLGRKNSEETRQDETA